MNVSYRFLAIGPDRLRGVIRPTTLHSFFFWQEVRFFCLIERHEVETTNNLYLDTECGINRVAIRSTPTPGTIKVTATRDGLKPATIEVKSVPVDITAGLSKEMPPQLAGPLAEVRAPR